MYVDDIIPVSNDIELLMKEKMAIRCRFKMVDNGDIEYFLGMQIRRDRGKRMLSISQPKYIESILERFGMSNCKPVSTPIENNARFIKRSQDEESFDINTYQKAVGSLTYLSTSSQYFCRYFCSSRNSKQVHVKSIH